METAIAGMSGNCSPHQSSCHLRNTIKSRTEETYVCYIQTCCTLSADGNYTWYNLAVGTNTLVQCRISQTSKSVGTKYTSKQWMNSLVASFGDMSQAKTGHTQLPFFRSTLTPTLSMHTISSTEGSGQAYIYCCLNSTLRQCKGVSQTTNKGIGYN